VHDAARCCIKPAAVRRLIEEVGDDEVGGLLALPVTDTLKRARRESGCVLRVADTVSRDDLWQAQTPQMFRYGLLMRALERFPEVTDEAGAVERLGMSPRLVLGDALNLKVTHPSDIELATAILRAQRG
ncbi:MAG: 2-C-methyl-D-erythritol 4-phosphate cytidylyltransferase, partial [Rhodocyclaceae bacterium]|nr:2-C-methyl-D-erythritol 4-phosphate cytidylyltransferase [Rhodocyclaceae bacterium]